MNKKRVIAGNTVGPPLPKSDLRETDPNKGSYVLGRELIGENIKYFGAVGNGVADDTSAIQAALDASHAAGIGVIRFPRGTYLLGDALKFYSNQHIIGEPGAVLLQKDGNTGGAYGNLMRNFYDGSGGYDATHDVIIENLIFDGGDQTDAPSTLLAMCHSQNIIIRNCTFQNGFSGGDVGNGHDIEINSSIHVTVDQCSFVNNRRKGLSSELVQVDVATGSAVYPWSPDVGERNDDGTVSKFVNVSNCRFKGVLHDNVYDRTVCVGSHSDAISENIAVSGCTIEDVAYGVMFAYGRNIFVTCNTILNSTVGFYSTSTDENLRFVGNILENCGNAYRTSKISGHGNVLNGKPFEQPYSYSKKEIEDLINTSISDALGGIENGTY
jgi:hypothetical protein